MKLCVCGVNCENCPHLGEECIDGCEALGGRVYWTCYISQDICPVYKCAKEKNYKNCGDCGQLPCELWYSLKDPSYTDEEHIRSINERTIALKEAKGN